MRAISRRTWRILAGDSIRPVARLPVAASGSDGGDRMPQPTDRVVAWGRRTLTRPALPGGRLNMRNQRHLDDAGPVQEDCPCLLCRRFSRAYLAHLFRAKELLAYRLATCHNLTFTLDFMARIRAALRAGSLSESLPELRARAGPVSSGEGAMQSA